MKYNEIYYSVYYIGAVVALRFYVMLNMTSTSVV